MIFAGSKFTQCPLFLPDGREYLIHVARITSHAKYVRFSYLVHASSAHETMRILKQSTSNSDFSREFAKADRSGRIILRGTMKCMTQQEMCS